MICYSIFSFCLASGSGSEEEEEEGDEEEQEDVEGESSSQSEGEEEEGEEEESVSGSGRSEHSAGKIVKGYPVTVTLVSVKSSTAWPLTQWFHLLQRTLVRKRSLMMTLKRRGKMGITYLQVSDQMGCVWRFWFHIYSEGWKSLSFFRSPAVIISLIFMVDCCWTFFMLKTASL